MIIAELVFLPGGKKDLVGMTRGDSESWRRAGLGSEQVLHPFLHPGQIPGLGGPWAAGVIRWGSGAWSPSQHLNVIITAL